MGIFTFWKSWVRRELCLPGPVPEVLEEDIEQWHLIENKLGGLATVWEREALEQKFMEVCKLLWEGGEVMDSLLESHIWLARTAEVLTELAIETCPRDVDRFEELLKGIQKQKARSDVCRQRKESAKGV